MFRNPLSILFSVINITEPPVADDDTEPMPALPEPEPPVMMTHPITAAALLTSDQLIGCQVAYRFDRASEWQVGRIRAVEDTRFGIKALFAPNNPDLSEKWRFINELVYVWWE